MKELHTFIHYFEQIVKHANLKGFDEMRVELEADLEAAEKRVSELEARADRAEECLSVLGWPA